MCQENEHNAEILSETPREKFYVYVNENVGFYDAKKPIRLEYINSKGEREGYKFNLNETLNLADALKRAAKDYITSEGKKKLKEIDE